MFVKPSVITLMVLAAAAWGVNAEETTSSEPALKELLEELEGLKQRVQELEQGSVSEASPLRGKTPEANNKIEAINSKQPLTFKGDFRYRHDTIDDEDNLEEPRLRHRFRARGAVEAKVNDSAEIVFGIASGDEDPISTNQTLGGASSSKDWRLDLAHFKWHFSEQLSGLGGKYKNNLFRPGGHFLLWDGDLRPEGLMLASKGQNWFGELGYNFVESDNRGGAQDSAKYYVSQLGSAFMLGDHKLTSAIGYYFFSTKGKGEIDHCNAFGNSITEEGQFKYDYQEVELSAEWKTQLGSVPFTMFADYVENLDAPEENIGYAIGLRLGKNKQPGDFRIAYSYQDLQADAVFAAFTDSDFAGGGTDNSGHLLKGSYVVLANMHFNVSYYDTHYGAFTKGEEHHFRRLFIDLVFKY